MHNYSVANRYKTQTKVGNWYEEKELDDHEFKQYLYKKENQQILTLNTATKLNFSQQKVELTKNTNGFINQGDVLQLKSLHTNFVLSFNVNQSILGEETYAVTGSPSLQPSLRNAFRIEFGGQHSSQTVKFGDKIRLTSMAGSQKLYLQSLVVSPMRSSKFSRHQQVSVTANINNGSLWVIEHVDAKERFHATGREVPAGESFLLKHLLTSQWLATDFVDYINEFGKEHQVYCKSLLTNNKTQNLFSEKVGHKTVNNVLRSQGLQNEWIVIKAE